MSGISACLLDIAFAVCNANTVCTDVYLVGNDKASFGSMVQLALASSTVAVPSTLIETIDATFCGPPPPPAAEAAVNDVRAVAAQTLLHLLLKFDVCFHNEYFSLDTQSCTCYAGRECITSERFAEHYSMTTRGLLLATVVLLALITLAMVWRTSRLPSELP